MQRATKQQETLQAPVQEILKSKGGEEAVEELENFGKEAGEYAQSFLRRRGALIGSVAGVFALGWLARRALRTRH